MFTKKHLISSTFAIAVLILGTTGFLQNSISDQHSIVEFVVNKMWPVTSIISFTFSFIHTFGYNRKQKRWKTFVSFFSFGSILFIVFSFCFQGTIELLNTNIGQTRNITIQGNILKAENKQHRWGNSSYSLKILHSNDTILLQVDVSYFKKYKNKSYFYEDMKKGTLGFIYKSN